MLSDVLWANFLSVLEVLSSMDALFLRKLANSCPVADRLC